MYMHFFPSPSLNFGLKMFMINPGKKKNIQHTLYIKVTVSIVNSLTLLRFFLKKTLIWLSKLLEKRNNKQKTFVLRRLTVYALKLTLTLFLGFPAVGRCGYESKAPPCLEPQELSLVPLFCHAFFVFSDFSTFCL
jgi:hypothetical protein